MLAEAQAETRGEWLALGALLLPWLILSMLLPLPHLVASVALLASLSMLVFAAARWSRMRAHDLGLDKEAWGLAAVLSLGFSMSLLLGGKTSGFDSLCDHCGRLSDARAPFCYGCGVYA